MNVAASGNFGYVSVSTERASAPTTLVAEIAKRFDAELATGKPDALFGKRQR